MAFENRTWSNCGEFLANTTAELESFNSPPNFSRTDSVETVVNKTIIPCVSLFGILGNCLNLIVLTRKRLQRSMDYMEKSAQLGLVALAISDVMVCVMYLTRSVISDEKVVYTDWRQLPQLYFHTYRDPLFNTFLLCSTWLTVSMAIGRYLVVCRPLHARGFISLRGTRISLSAACIGSVVVNLPRFWHYQVEPTFCGNEQCSCYYYMKIIGVYYSKYKGAVLAYNVVYSVIGIFMPLLVLTVCNVCLVRALRRSYQLQKNCVSAAESRQSRKNSRHRITPTLIGLIVLFLLLVGPSEVLIFFREHVIRNGSSQKHLYHGFVMANVLTNFMPLVNFAVNFVLYCVINVHFRRTCVELFTCRRRLERSDSAEQMTYTGRSKTNQTIYIGKSAGTGNTKMTEAKSGTTYIGDTTETGF